MPNVIDVNDYRQYDTTKVSKFEEGALILLLDAPPTQAIKGILQMMQNTERANRKLYVVAPDKAAIKLDAFVRTTSIRVLSDYGKVGIVKDGKVRVCTSSDVYDLVNINYSEQEVGVT